MLSALERLMTTQPDAFKGTESAILVDYKGLKVPEVTELRRQVRGAKNSMHMYCAAADIQISGVSKWELAKYLRSMPGRGGVGTYCHTESVHVDIGPERDWNWRCRRRS